MEIQILQFLADGEGFRDRPGTVGVDHDLRLASGGLHGGADLIKPDLVQLDIAVTSLDRPVRGLGHIVDVSVTHQACIHFQLVGECAAKQAVERLAGGFSQQIPQRDIDRRNAVLDTADAAEIVQLKLQIVLDLGNLACITADDQRQ